ncbi:putative polyol transporter 1 [Rhodamnia argentea]|uniref:Polyol transporter 1 n=1 Tax=Rhodamnia argentea TaxID=178133 RepID=A0A8B8PZD0_9MYRT|nr:putative polyol transporter 1 [Rhodamnia argentea]
MLAGAGFIISCLLIGSGGNYTVLQVGCLFAITDLGYDIDITPMYILKVSPTSSRGKLTSFPEAFFNVGAVLSHISNYFFRKVQLDHGWCVLLKLGALSSYLLTIGVLAMSESPRWLIMYGLLNDMMQILKPISDSNEESKIR